MGNNIKSVDNSGLSEATRQVMDLDANYTSGRSGAGIFGDNLTEAVPNYIQSPCESVTQHGNSWIVLGRDRPASRASGYAGQGHTQASSIDIVVGRGAPVPTNNVNVDPNFSNDAARIYISQKTDIDENFRIVKGGMGYSTAKSGIGMKADAVRIIGTEGIKLVTRTSSMNSKGGSAPPSGIELIAVNDQEGLQPMIKGDNMVEALSELEKRINEISSQVLNFMKAQISFNTAVVKHSHQGSAGPVPVVVLPDMALVPPATRCSFEITNTMADNFKGRMNISINWHQKYLSPISAKYICSKYNKVN